jgi:integrase
VHLSADTGLRISDVLNLPRTGLKHTMEITERKTGKVRTVHLRPYTLALCRQWAATHSGDKLITCNRSTIYRHIVRAARKHNLTNVSMHSIRKFYATQYCKAHGLMETQKEMQHDYPTTTLLYVVDLAQLGGESNALHRNTGKRTQSNPQRKRRAGGRGSNRDHAPPKAPGSGGTDG